MLAMTIKFDSFISQGLKQVGDIQHLLSSYHSSLPNSYNLFLNLTNGGWLDNMCCVTIPRTEIEKSNQEQASISNFYGLVGQTAKLKDPNYGNLFDASIYDIIENTETYLNYKHDSIRINKDLIVIGGDDFNNQTCLSLGKENYGSVYFWDHAVAEFDLNLEKTPKIASSFTEFLELLIHQNSGYIENLSEVYEEIKKV
jgi:SMI1 / KNR4 family (SUKH-1)